METKHRQELDAEKKADKDAAEKKKKDDAFNAKALKVVTNYNKLQSEVNKFEKLVKQKQAANKKLDRSDLVQEGKALLNDDYINVY